MKGISTTLVIIITAVVVLVAALVVLSIFGGGIQPVVDITQARSVCLSEAAGTCSLTGQMPSTWNSPIKSVNVGGRTVAMACSDGQLAACSDCIGCGLSVPG
jgi:hypothetical protein